MGQWGGLWRELTVGERFTVYQAAIPVPVPRLIFSQHTLGKNRTNEHTQIEH